MTILRARHARRQSVSRLEAEIQLAWLGLVTAESRDKRREQFGRMKALIQRRSSSRIRAMEKARGLS